MEPLARKTVLGFVQLVAALGLFLFLPAGTVHYWQGWAYLPVFAASAALITAYLWRNDPKLLERRVRAGPGAEKERSQKWIQAFASLFFLGILVLSSLDHRLSWSQIPVPAVILGIVLVAIGFRIIFIVFRETPIPPRRSR